MVDEAVLGSRGYGAAITSWQHPAGEIDNVPQGESILSVTVYLWDPKGDLGAYIQTHMRDNWSASGVKILDEEEVSLGGDHPAVVFMIRNSSTNDESLVLVTLAGENYLVISGSGDLPLLKEIALTGRFTN